MLHCIVLLLCAFIDVPVSLDLIILLTDVI